MLMDVIPHMAALNLMFQQRNVDIAGVQPAINEALKAIKDCEEGKGLYRREFKEKIEKDGNQCTYKGISITYDANSVEEAKEVRRSFLSSLRKKLLARFPESQCSLVNCLSVLGMRQRQNPDSLTNYGDEEIQTLCDHFGYSKKNMPPLIDPSKTTSEWMMVKSIVAREKYRTCSFRELWEVLYCNHKDTFPNLFVLAAIALVLPLQTADVERAFSCQNLIKTSLRNRLSPQMVYKLMLVDLEGPDEEDFDFRAVVQAWKAVKQRNIFS